MNVLVFYTYTAQIPYIHVAKMYKNVQKEESAKIMLKYLNFLVQDCVKIYGKTFLLKVLKPFLNISITFYPAFIPVKNQKAHLPKMFQPKFTVFTAD